MERIEGADRMERIARRVAEERNRARVRAARETTERYYDRAREELRIQRGLI